MKKNLTKEEAELLKNILEEYKSDIVCISKILKNGKMEKINSKSLFDSIIRKLQNILEEK